MGEGEELYHILLQESICLGSSAGTTSSSSSSGSASLIWSISARRSNFLGVCARSKGELRLPLNVWGIAKASSKKDMLIPLFMSLTGSR